MPAAMRDLWRAPPGSDRRRREAPPEAAEGPVSGRAPRRFRPACPPRTVVVRRTSRRRSPPMSRCRSRTSPACRSPAPATCNGRCRSPDRHRSAERLRWRGRCRNRSPSRSRLDRRSGWPASRPGGSRRHGAQRGAPRRSGSGSTACLLSAGPAGRRGAPTASDPGPAPSPDTRFRPSRRSRRPSRFQDG